MPYFAIVVTTIGVKSGLCVPWVQWLGDKEVGKHKEPEGDNAKLSSISSHFRSTAI
jgi:hypothetical protein